MLNAKITGIASFLPDDVLDNEMLSQMVDTNDEWITTRVGVKERRILKKPVGSSYMGIQAVNKLLEETGVDRNDIDLLICPTSNPDHRFPSTASIIAHGVGIEKKCYAYDIQAACAGFLVGLYEATAFIRAGIYKKVIVVSAECQAWWTITTVRHARCSVMLQPACCWNPPRSPSVSWTASSTWTVQVLSTWSIRQAAQPCAPATKPLTPTSTAFTKRVVLSIAMP